VTATSCSTRYGCRRLTALAALCLAFPFAATAQLQTTGSAFFSQGSPGVEGNPELGDLFGAALAVGDFNCDGFDDLAVGVPWEDSDVTHSGAVNVFYGGVTGLSTAELWDQSDVGVPSSNEAHDHFGAVLEAFDSSEDFGFCHSLAIGAPDEDVNGTLTHVDAGAVFVLRGTPNGLVGDGILVQGQNGVPESPEDNDRFGASISQGPITGDPTDCPGTQISSSLLVGAPGEGLGLLDNGDGVVVRINMPCGVSGGGAGDLPSFVNCSLSAPVPCRVLSADDFNLPIGLDPSDGFGESLALLNYKVGSGTAPGDPIIGIPSANEISGSASIGAILESESNYSAAGSEYWTQDSSGVQNSAESSDRFGEVLEEGDFDGDGDDDLAIGTPGENKDSTIDVGIIQVLYSVGTAPNKELTATGDFHAEQGNLTGETSEADDRFGAALAAGDFDGDGVEDLAVGVPGENLSSPRVVVNGGAVNVLYGVAGTGLATAGAQQFDGDDLLFNGARTQSFFGSALAAGDFDGNGIDDLAIGEPGSQDLLNSEGFIWVVYGADNVLGYVSFLTANSSYAESVGSIQVNVNRTGSAITSANATVRVKPGGGGTATAGVDYNFTSAPLHWDAGELGVQSVFVPIINDTEAELTETIVLELDASGTGLAEQNPKEVVLSISDNEPASFEFQVSESSVAESVGNASLLVIRTGGSWPAASVSWVTGNGSGPSGALAGQDFTASGGTLNWSLNEKGGKSIQIPITNDTTPEDNEVFAVILQNPSGATLSAPAVSIVTILANDDDGSIFSDGFE